MKNLMAVAKKCMKILDSLNIDYDKDTEFSINYRARKRFGQAKYDRNTDTHSINIASGLLYDEVPDKSLETVVLHELLHTVSGAMNHGKKWQSLANRVNKEFFYKITTTNTTEDYNLTGRSKEFFTPKKTYKYAIQCADCGKIYKKQRMCDCIAHPEFYHCGVCGSKLNRIY